MAGRLEVDPDKLQQLSTAAAAIPDRLAAIEAAAAAATAPGSAAWGADTYGSGFEGGDSRFPERDKATRAVTKEVTTAFETFAEGQSQSARRLTEGEQTNTGTFS